KVSSLLSLGFPIRTSPDYRLLASPRGLSQLATSFIAYLRQGIHTHALSSLTIKSTLRLSFLLLSPVLPAGSVVLPNEANRFLAVAAQPNGLFFGTNPIRSPGRRCRQILVSWQQLQLVLPVNNYSVVKELAIRNCRTTAVSV